MTDIVLVSIIAGSFALTTGITTALINRVHTGIRGVHDIVNSRMTEMLHLARIAAHAEGVEEEKSSHLQSN
jgi:hypothetical protein